MATKYFIKVGAFQGHDREVSFAVAQRQVGALRYGSCKFVDRQGRTHAVNSDSLSHVVRNARDLAESGDVAEVYVDAAGPTVWVYEQPERDTIAR